MELYRDLPSGVELDRINGGGKKLLAVYPHVGTCLKDWSIRARAWLTGALMQEGALLLRGFGISSAAEFEQCVKNISPKVASFDEESGPRHIVEGQVFNSTDYPSPYPIQFHNEYSYAQCWPMKVFFCCARASTSGGETPLADSRCVLARLSDKTVNKFMELGVCYHRSYSPYLGVSWQTAFGTEDPREAVRRCRAAGIEATWRNERLLTKQYGHAVLKHPHTHEAVWFNHGFFFNPQSLEPLSVRKAVLQTPTENLTTNTTYGDGSVIEDSVIDDIREAYVKEKTTFRWQEGDLLILDNMLCAHARNPYVGNREILAMFADKVYRVDAERH